MEVESRNYGKHDTGMDMVECSFASAYALPVVTLGIGLLGIMFIMVSGNIISNPDTTWGEVVLALTFGLMMSLLSVGAGYDYIMACYR